MTYFLWALPMLTVFAAIVSGRANTTIAAVLGLLVAVPVTLLLGPVAFDTAQLGQALLRGLWVGTIIVPYILGGLLFWQVAARGASTHAGTTTAPVQVPLGNRRLVFFACFLVGPFAESVTGFGVGMLGTVMLIRHLGFRPRQLMVFALLSQTVIPWGVMSSATLLAAAYARVPVVQLGVYSVLPVALLMLIWMPLFWRTARGAGVGAPLSEHVRESIWVAVSLGLLTVATQYLGPEAALLAAYGPLIVIRYLLDFRPRRKQAIAAARNVLPYIVLIIMLALTRLLPDARNTLATLLALTPFDDLPTLSPFLHAGSWLIVGTFATAAARQQVHVLVPEAQAAWRTGKQAVLTVFLFAMIAEVLTASGIADAFATGTLAALGEKAILVTPLLSGTLSILTNNANSSSILFLPAQVALASQAGLSVLAVATLQHVTATAMCIFSPVRMSIAAGLAHGHGQERLVYRELLPAIIAAYLLLLTMAAWVMTT